MYIYWGYRFPNWNVWDIAWLLHLQSHPLPTIHFQTGRGIIWPCRWIRIDWPSLSDPRAHGDLREFASTLREKTFAVRKFEGVCTRRYLSHKTEWSALRHVQMATICKWEPWKSLTQQILRTRTKFEHVCILWTVSIQNSSNTLGQCLGISGFTPQASGTSITFCLGMDHHWLRSVLDPGFSADFAASQRAGPVTWKPRQMQVLLLKPLGEEAPETLEILQKAGHLMGE